MRKPSSPSAPAVAPATLGDTLLADLLLTVVTPMFGGGVEAGELDEDNLIRPSAIRGHLRFWWRACNAAGFTSLTELHERERLLWGSAAKKDDPTHGPGAIAVRVTDVVAGRRLYHHEIERPGRSSQWEWRLEGHQHRESAVLDYVLFPFTKQESKAKAALDGMVGITFRLQLTVAPHSGKRVEWPRPGEWVEWPDAVECREAAEQALWAWIAFGGVGSRTRRGCGTLLCTGNGDGVPDDQLPKHQEIAEEGEAVRVSDEVLDDQPPKHRLASALFRPSGDVARWLTTRLSHPRYVAAPVAGHITTVPMLTGCRISTNTPVGQHMNAWVTAIRPLQQFLQGEKIGRNPKYRDPDRVRRNDSMRPGQSFWPEVGAARAILNAPARKDDYGDVYTKLSPADATGKQFPRTDLGLPRLIKVGSDNGDPVATVERNQQDFTRMASPIILKALPVSATDAVPIAICLTAPHIWDHGSPGLKLKGPGQPGLHLDPHPLNDPNPANRPTWPRALPPHVTDPGVESARDAFMEFVLDDPSWEGWP